ncbi:PqqD family protein [Rathayibacter sp. ZW T2_19]|uniref:PqqD family protein n=1 Tax=Rathayibacter rubneri TaxID=2950106 RepID=A0A9X2DVR7_9MICO|nr:PqqD family protein [Rathayibacter rubneri]MCM6761091.1 PqqD family protein [Rathayibacter rubneri]
MFRRSESSAWSIGEQSALVVDLASSRDPVPVLLRDSAFSLWLLLDEPRTLASLGRAMSEIFRVEEDRAIHDIDRFLRDLTERGLVR